MVDLRPEMIQIMVTNAPRRGLRLWVNTEGGCELRAQGEFELLIDDERREREQCPTKQQDQ